MSAKAKTTGAVNAPAAVVRGVLGPWVDYTGAGGYKSHLSSTIDPLYRDAGGRPHSGQARINEGVEGDPIACRAWCLFEDEATGYTRPLMRGRRFKSVDEAKRACEAAFKAIPPAPPVKFYTAAATGEDEYYYIAHIGQGNGLSAHISGVNAYCEDDEEERIEGEGIYEIQIRDGDKNLGDCWRGRGDEEDAKKFAAHLLLEDLVDKEDEAFEDANPLPPFDEHLVYGTPVNWKQKRDGRRIYHRAVAFGFRGEFHKNKLGSYSLKITDTSGKDYFSILPCYHSRASINLDNARVQARHALLAKVVEHFKQVRGIK